MVGDDSNSYHDHIGIENDRLRSTSLDAVSRSRAMEGCVYPDLLDQSSSEHSSDYSTLSDIDL